MTGVRRNASLPGQQERSLIGKPPMGVAKYGSIEVEPPLLDGELQVVDRLDANHVVTDFRYQGGSVRHLDIENQRLARGEIVDTEAQRCDLRDASLDSISFRGCTMLSGRWQDCSLSRVEFRHCRILGLTISVTKLANVVFEDCRIEYVTFEDVRSVGAVVFENCRFRETSLVNCDMSRGCLKDCDLEGVELSGGNFRGFDLRGTDLSTVRGAGNLRGATVSPAQRGQIAEALVSEVELRYEADSR
jgi:uncharacterized protein YjbI with pentapeptide repeats